MAIEKRYTLRQAAKLAGIGRHTLRRWLEVDLAMVFPPVERGSFILIREADLEAVLRKHTAHSDWTLLRTRREQVA